MPSLAERIYQFRKTPEGMAITTLRQAYEAHTEGEKVTPRDVLNALDDREDVRSFQGRECKRSCCQRFS
jgi:hypothetical protein